MKTKAKKYLLISIFMFSILMAGCKANVDIQEPKEAKTEQAESDEMVDLQEDIVNSERTDDSDTEEFSVSALLQRPMLSLKQQKCRKKA